MAEAFPEAPDLENNVATRIIKIRNFSNTKQGDKIRDDDIFYKRNFIKLFQIRVYPSGKGRENKDFVSVLIRKRWIPEYPLSFECIVNVVNADHKLRLPQSFGFTSVGERNVEDIGLERFVRRQYLLDEASEFLPNDTLTLQFKVSYKIELAQNPSADKFWNVLNLLCEIFPKEDNEAVVEPSKKWTYIIETMEGDTFPLNFESGEKTRGSDVLEASPVIQRMFETEMREKLEKRVKLVDVDQNTLGNFLSYIESKKLVTKTIMETFKLYEMADKYLVQSLQRDCAIYLVRNLNPDNIAEISAMAHHYRNSDELFIHEIANYFKSKQIILVETSSDDENLLKDLEYVRSDDLVSNRKDTDNKLSPQTHVQPKILVLMVSFTDVCIFFEIAIEYGLVELQQECRKFLKRNINVKNVTEILKTAQETNDYELQTMLADFMLTNADSLEESDKKDILWLNERNSNKEIVGSKHKISISKIPESQSLEYDENLTSDQFEFYGN